MWILFTALLAAGPNDMVAIPAGEFTMGRTKLTSDDKTTMRPHVLLDDLPARKVRMSAFQLCQKTCKDRRVDVVIWWTCHRFSRWCRADMLCINSVTFG